MQEGGGAEAHAVHQVARMALAGGARLGERAAAAHAELVAGAGERRQLDVFGGRAGGASIYRELWKRKISLVWLLNDFFA